VAISTGRKREKINKQKEEKKNLKERKETSWE
jgi:hypothetical protein